MEGELSVLRVRNDTRTGPYELSRRIVAVENMMVRNS